MAAAHVLRSRLLLRANLREPRHGGGVAVVGYTRGMDDDDKWRAGTVLGALLLVEGLGNMAALLVLAASFAVDRWQPVAVAVPVAVHVPLSVPENPWGFSLVIKPDGTYSYYVRDTEGELGKALVGDVLQDAAALHANTGR